MRIHSADLLDVVRETQLEGGDWRGNDHLTERRHAHPFAVNDADERRVGRGAGIALRRGEDVAAVDRRAELNGLEGQVAGRTPFPAYHVVKAERLHGVPFDEGQLRPLWKKIQLKVNRVYRFGHPAGYVCVRFHSLGHFVEGLVDDENKSKGHNWRERVRSRRYITA